MRYHLNTFLLVVDGMLRVRLNTARLSFLSLVGILSLSYEESIGFLSLIVFPFFTDSWVCVLVFLF